MRIRIVQGRAAGQVEECDEATAQSMVDSGYAELEPSGDDRGGVGRGGGAGATEGAKAAETATRGSRRDPGSGVSTNLASCTIAALEDLGDEYGIEAADIDGTGAGGNVVKADWVRVLSARVAGG